jgi:hypothetical protein
LGALTEVIAGRKEVRPAQTEAQATGAIGTGAIGTGAIGIAGAIGVAGTVGIAKGEKDAAGAETGATSARINGITWGTVYVTAIVM